MPVNCGPEGNRSHKFASRLATPPHFTPAGPITICGPEGNRTPYSSMPWKRVTGIPQAPGLD
ncbi:MAG: hypothetical protein UU45_C0011G0013 [Candidatus Levybacteria bacterium GW2011_GWA2_41_15]|nr:MAG: hypothetical protein UU45_C0011G0013 [Candidatus Levybacteria bacterium GW2011_GWA2_41_15]